MLIRYAIAGLLNTIVAFLIYSAIVTFSAVPFWIASFVAMCASILSGYLLGHFFVFPASGRPMRSSGWRYISTFAVQYGVGTALIAVGVRFGLSEVLAYVAALPAMIAVSFALQQRWVFSHGK